VSHCPCPNPAPDLSHTEAVKLLQLLSVISTLDNCKQSESGLGESVPQTREEKQTHIQNN
jgi:hypothetical protein